VSKTPPGRTSIGREGPGAGCLHMGFDRKGKLSTSPWLQIGVEIQEKWDGTRRLGYRGSTRSMPERTRRRENWFITGHHQRKKGKSSGSTSSRKELRGRGERRCPTESEGINEGKPVVFEMARHVGRSRGFGKKETNCSDWVGSAQDSKDTRYPFGVIKKSSS